MVPELSPPATTSNPQHVYTACGKFILVGEHFILYDIPALALPWQDVELSLLRTPSAHTVRPAIQDTWQHARQLVGLPITQEFPFVLQSTIPQGAGFGSSAALCLCLLQAAADEAHVSFSLQEQIQHATTLESLFHGRSSGLDPTVVAWQQPLRVHMGHPPQPLSWQLPGFGFVLAVSREQRQTAQAVHQVRQFSEQNPASFQEMRQTMQSLVLAVESLIAEPLAPMSLSVESRAKKLGEYLDQNHALLQTLGISSPHLEQLISTARDHGAWGAKLTGAGLGGGMLALAPTQHVSSLSHALQRGDGRHVTICRPHPTDRLHTNLAESSPCIC